MLVEQVPVRAQRSPQEGCCSARRGRLFRHRPRRRADCTLAGTHAASEPPRSHHHHCFLAPRRCHLILSNLRPARSSGITIGLPRGFLFEFISCPNYTAEIMGWVRAGAGSMGGWSMGQWGRGLLGPGSSGSRMALCQQHAAAERGAHTQPGAARRSRACGGRTSTHLALRPLLSIPPQVGFTVATQALPAAIFTLVGAGQMAVWAAGKHRRLKKVCLGWN